MDIFSGWILFMLVVMLVAIRFEKREWNNGVCKKSGLKWVIFDIDSQGDRGYKDGIGNYCWISYPTVDKVR